MKSILLQRAQRQFLSTMSSGLMDVLRNPIGKTWIPILLLLCFLVLPNLSSGQTYYDMSSGNYSQTFTGLSTAYPTNFNGLAVLATGSIPIATKTTTATNGTLAVVGTSTALGYDAIVANSTKMIFLCTGGTDNSAAVGCDLNLNFTGRTAGSLSFNYANILNSPTASPNGRSSSLVVYYSTDGSTWTALGGPYTVYDNTGASTANVPVSVTLPSALDNKPTVKLRFYEYNGGAVVGTPTGSRSKISLDDIVVTSTAIATPSIAISAAHPVASNVNLGSDANIIGGIKLDVTTANTTLTGVTITTAGTYITGDLKATTPIKIYLNATNDLSGSPVTLGTSSAVGPGSNISLTGLTAAINSGTSRYIIVTADINAAATVGNTISLGSTAFSNITFSSGTKTGSDPVAAGNNQTISQITPTISLANGTIANANINQNSTNIVLYRSDFTVGVTSAFLTDASFTTAGTYTATDISNLKLWYSTSATFSTGTASLIATKTTGLGAGLQTFSSLSQNIAIGSGYLYLTTDVPCYGTINATINVSATSTGDFTFTLGSATGSGFTDGGIQTIIAGTTTPNNATLFTPIGNGTTGQITATWTAPVGCYSEVMIVASSGTTFTVAPTGDGSSYIANTTFGSGTPFDTGFVMYKGTSSPQTFTGFSNGVNYRFKIFTRYNSVWSAGTEITNINSYTTTALTEVVVPQYIQGVGSSNRVPSAYCVTLSGLTPNATYRYNNQAVVTTDTGATAGAGNTIYTGTSQSASFVETSGSGFSTVGNYGTFTTNGSGSYTGWFITEPTGNTRFTPGNQVSFRIRLNDGNNGTLVDRVATTTSSSKVITFATAAGANNGTAIRGTSLANAKDFVCLYDNTTGTGRPLAATYLEDDGNASVASFAAFITSNVNGVAGAWGVIIPNTLPNGVQRIETRSFTSGAVICSATDADGVWPTGSINTVNPAGGTTTVLVINTVDAGLNCSSVALSHTGIAQTTASTENLNSNNNIVSNFRVNTSTYATTLNSISFVAGGTFVAGNVANFKLFTSTSSSFPGGTALSTVSAASIASGDTVTFSGLAQACTVGARYFWIVADFGITGTGNTIQVPALGNTDFSFASNASITSNAITAGGLVTLGTVIPSVALSSSSIGAAAIYDGGVNTVLYRADAAVSVTSAELNSIAFTTGGTYLPADFTNFKLWYSTSSTFAVGTSTLLVTKTTGLDAGLQTFSGLTQTISSGTTGYFYLTADLPCSTTLGNTLSVNAVIDTDVVFSLGATISGAGTSTSDQTITAATPSNVTVDSTTATGLTGEVTLAFTLPTSCYDDIMIVAAPTSVNTGTPTNGSTYTVGAVLGNGSVVYVGTASPQTISGLTDGTPYYFKVYTRNGALWSVGTTDVTATPFKAPALTEVLVPQYMQGTTVGSNSNRIPYAYRVTLFNLTPGATYRYYNQVVATTENASSLGAGAVLFPSAGGFTRTTAPSLSSAGNYGTFTTDGTGSYTGWFISEPTGNATRFTPGTSVKMRIILNDGNNGTAVATRLSTSSPITVITLGTGATATEGTAIRGTSVAAAKNFVMLWNTTAGTGRPISGTFIESDGTANTSANNYASFYSTSVEGVAGAWGTIIPNTSLSNGIRRIQQYKLSDGSATGLTATDSDGVWPSGADTTNPSGGTTALVVTKFEAPLEDIATSSVLSGTTTVCFGPSIDLSVAITGGASPYTVVYTDGTNNITKNNYVSGDPISFIPSTTATYTLVSVTGANSLVGIGNSGSAIVTVNPVPTASISGSTTTCQNEISPPTITFTGANGTSVYKFSYRINGGSLLTVNSVAGGIASVVVPTGTIGSFAYTLESVQDNATGCSQSQTGTATVVVVGGCTALSPNLRGTTLTDLNNTLSAIQVSGAVSYSFELRKDGQTAVKSVFTRSDVNKSLFSLLQFQTAPATNPQTILYNTKYWIKVAVNGSAFGVEYFVITPANVPTTKLANKYCGATITALNEPVYANSVYGASKYKFKVSGPGINEELEVSGTGLNLTKLTQSPILYGTAYTIQVKASIDGTTYASPYGASCIVNTPFAAPTSRIDPKTCGKTVSMASAIYPLAVYGVDAYYFEVSGGNLATPVGFEATNLAAPAFKFNQITGATTNQTYSVRVSVRFNGVYPTTNGIDKLFGTSCTISTGASRMSEIDLGTLNVFNVSAFPNPFARHFSVQIESSSDELVEMKVYDMIGRELEAHKATVSELSTREIGNNYPSGVYNIVVSQGDRVKSLRMIKR